MTSVTSTCAHLSAAVLDRAMDLASLLASLQPQQQQPFQQALSNLLSSCDFDMGLSSSAHAFAQAQLQQMMEQSVQQQAFISQLLESNAALFADAAAAQQAATAAQAEAGAARAEAIAASEVAATYANAFAALTTYAQGLMQLTGRLAVQSLSAHLPVRIIGLFPMGQWEELVALFAVSTLQQRMWISQQLCSCSSKVQATETLKSCSVWLLQQHLPALSTQLCSDVYVLDPSNVHLLLQAKQCVCQLSAARQQLWLQAAAACRTLADVSALLGLAAAMLKPPAAIAAASTRLLLLESAPAPATQQHQAACIEAAAAFINTPTQAVAVPALLNCMQSPVHAAAVVSTGVFSAGVCSHTGGMRVTLPTGAVLQLPLSCCYPYGIRPAASFSTFDASCSIFRAQHLLAGLKSAKSFKPMRSTGLIAAADSSNSNSISISSGTTQGDSISSAVSDGSVDTLGSCTELPPDAIVRVSISTNSPKALQAAASASSAASNVRNVLRTCLLCSMSGWNPKNSKAADTSSTRSTSSACSSTHSNTRGSAGVTLGCFGGFGSSFVQSAAVEVSYDSLSDTTPLLGGSVARSDNFALHSNSSRSDSNNSSLAPAAMPTPTPGSCTSAQGTKPYEGASRALRRLSKTLHKLQHSLGRVQQQQQGGCDSSAIELHCFEGCAAEGPPATAAEAGNTPGQAANNARRSSADTAAHLKQDSSSHNNSCHSNSINSSSSGWRRVFKAEMAANTTAGRKQHTFNASTALSALSLGQLQATAPTTAVRAVRGSSCGDDLDAAADSDVTAAVTLQPRSSKQQPSAAANKPAGVSSWAAAVKTFSFRRAASRAAGLFEACSSSNSVVALAPPVVPVMAIREHFGC